MVRRPGILCSEHAGSVLVALFQLFQLFSVGLCISLSNIAVPACNRPVAILALVGAVCTAHRVPGYSDFSSTQASGQDFVCGGVGRGGGGGECVPQEPGPNN